MQGQHQQLKLSHCLLGAGSSSAACIPSAQQHMSTQHGMRPAHVLESSAPVPAGVVVNKSTGSVHPNNCMTAQPFTAPLQGLCFSLPSSTTSDSDTGSSGGSSSQNGTSSSSQDSRQGNPSARMQAPGSAELLCDSPGLSSDSMSMDSPAHSPAGHHHPASKRHCQHKHAHADDRAASGMQTHQLDCSCKQNFTLPSLHSMLGSSAAASKPQAPSAGAAAAHTQQGNAVDSAPAARVSSMLSGSVGAQHNAGMQDNSAHHPNSLQEPTAIPHASPSSGFVPTHAPQAVGTATNQRSDAAGAAAAGSALAAVRSGELDAVQAFLRACAAPGVVTALAVLAQNSLMPVLPVLPVSEEDGPTYTPLCATLAHMFVLAARGAVLERLNDTTMRTLLWMTESFFSQYRSSCRICAFDYLCYDLGQRSHTMELDDPFVLDTLAEEVPTMVKLQRHILLASEWSLLVTEQQLQFACSILEAAGSSSCSIDSIQAEVDYFAQKGRGRSSGVVQVYTEDKQAQQQQQQHQQVPHRLQLFPGEVITGMLVADTGLLDATAAAEAAAEDAAMVDEQMLDDLVVVQLPRQQQQQQKVQKPLQAISCASTLQSVDPFSPGIRVLQSHPNQQQGNPQVQKQEQQEKQQKPHTRLQHRLAQRNQALDVENAQPSAGHMAAAAGASAARQVPAADSRRAKDQLLQLASRQQAVGSKRRRTTAAAAAAVGAGPVAGAQEHVQEQQQGGLGAFGAGGKRILLKVMRTAQSAAHFLGCRPQ